MTRLIGAFNHHTERGKNRRAIQFGMAIATSQKNGAMAATMTTPKN